MMNQSVLRPIPAHIVRPPYVTTGRPPIGTRVAEPKSAELIERMRTACAAARRVLNTVLSAVEIGVTTEALDQISHAACIAEGGYPSPLGYHGFPKSLCTSINEVVCHGIPEARRLKSGDIINCDVTIYLNGVHGDCSETVFVGEIAPEDRALVEVTYACMEAGINVVKPGARLNAIGKAITSLAKKHGYSVVREFGGHGIGEGFHEPPSVAHNYDRKGRLRLQEGMIFTIEPMINAGQWQTRLLTDGWTAVTIDGRRSAQFEHTCLVTATGVERLTDGGVPFFKR